jgi:hypothetical protein
MTIKIINYYKNGGIVLAAEKTKKPFYKNWWVSFFVILIIGVLTSCGEEDTKQSSTPPNEETKVEEPKKEEPKKEDNPKKETESKVASNNDLNKDKESNKYKIDTSVYSYAKKVDVTDAIELNNHVTVFVHMHEDTKPGLATQHVINQTYDFLQQKDIEGAKTVTVAVKQGDIKIAQFTVNKEKFTPIDDKPMSECVLKASKIEFMTDEVKEYGTIMNTW